MQFPKSAQETQGPSELFPANWSENKPEDAGDFPLLLRGTQGPPELGV